LLIMDGDLINATLMHTLGRRQKVEPRPNYGTVGTTGEPPWQGLRVFILNVDFERRRLTLSGIFSLSRIPTGIPIWISLSFFYNVQSTVTSSPNIR
jgi:hypothetical protein